MDVALNYTENGFILDPLEHLTDLFLEGNFEQVKKDAIKIAYDPSYKYYDFKKIFNSEAQHLLGSGDPKWQQSGLYILQLMTEVYPDSQSAWYSFGNALENNNQIDKAKAAYKKLISLKPNSMMGRAAKQRLSVLNK